MLLVLYVFFMGALVLDADTVDDCRRLVACGRGRELENVDITSVTLSGAFDFACTRWLARERGDELIEFVGKRWSAEQMLLDRSWTALVLRKYVIEETHGAPPVEIRPAPVRDELDGTDWALFLQRFERALKLHGGFAQKLATSLSSALAEMVGNVIEHSTPQGHLAQPSIVGFQVEKDSMTYAVADLGRGVLASLQENPLWSHLQTSRAALEAAILQHATRRQQMRQGAGFRQVVRALADMHGHLRFRSGDAVLLLDGRGDTREAVQRRSPPMQGLQLAVRCSLRSSS